MSNSEYQDLIAFLGRRFEEIGRHFDAVDHRFEAMDRRFDRVEAKLAEHDARIEAIDGRFCEGFGHFDHLYRRMGRLEQDTRRFWKGSGGSRAFSWTRSSSAKTSSAGWRI